MKAVILKSFPYSDDGIHVTVLKVGDEFEISDALAPGLIKEGFIAEPPKARPKVGLPLGDASFTAAPKSARNRNAG